MWHDHYIQVTYSCRRRKCNNHETNPKQMQTEGIKFSSSKKIYAWERCLKTVEIDLMSEGEEPGK